MTLTPTNPKVPFPQPFFFLILCPIEINQGHSQKMGGSYSMPTLTEDNSPFTSIHEQFPKEGKRPENLIDGKRFNNY